MKKKKNKKKGKRKIIKALTTKNKILLQKNKIEIIEEDSDSFKKKKIKRKK